MTGGGHELRLVATLDLNAASPLAADLLACRGQNLAVNASDVQRMGAQCLQVLMAAKRRWAADGHELTITDPSAPFSATLSLLGAATLLPGQHEDLSP